jgi:RNA-splicing ligase RtcB
VWDATEDADAFYAIEAFGLVNVLAHTLPRGTMVAVCRELVRRYPTAMRAALLPEEDSPR